MRNAVLIFLSLALLLGGIITLGFVLGFAVAQMWAAVDALTWVLGVLALAAAACAFNIREHKPNERRR